MAQQLPPPPQSPMPPTAATRPPARRRSLFLPTFTLAGWRLRQTWRLLLLTGLGTIAAVMLVCAVPLYSEIALSAGLRGALARDPNANQITISINSNLSSESQVQQTQQQLDQLIKHDMGPYVTQSSVFSISLGNLNIASVSNPTATGGQNVTPSNNNTETEIVGINDGEMTNHIALVSGHMPQADPKQLEVLLTQNDASSLQASVGSVLNINLPVNGTGNGSAPPSIPLLVTGIYTQQQTSDPIFITNIYYGPNGKASAIVPIASNQALLAAVAQFEAVFAKTNPNGGDPVNIYPGPPPFNWYYKVDLSQVTINNLDDLTQRLQNTYSDISNLSNGGIGGGFSSQGGQGLGLLGALITYKIEIIIAQVPIVFLLLQVMGLILLFITLMINLLVERQADAIAVLRSRGAPRRMVFRSMTVQTICVCLLALVAGPILAFLLVNAVATTTLGSQQNGAISVILGHPVEAAWGLRWYALVTVLIAFIAMLISTSRAANNNILALRRDSARSNRKPFWQRLNLDVVFAIIAFVGYALYTLALSRVPAVVSLFLSPLALVAPLFILLAVSLLFLRFFPALLRLLAKMAVRSRNAAPMLAISQMARSPQQASRMTLLMALSTAFALFTLIFSASQYQRTLDTTSFTVGADFSGQLSNSVSSTNLGDVTAKYQQIAGVTSASVAYVGNYSPNSNINNIQISYIAADTSTYGQTVIWPAQDGPTAATLASELASQRSQAIASGVVPAVVDQAFLEQMRLDGAGSHFSIAASGDQASGAKLNFSVLAVVRNIPTLFNSADPQFSNGTGGLLVDYQTLAAIYRQDGVAALPAPTTVWLRTQDDSGSLAAVRAALNSGQLAVAQMQDRRAMISAIQQNPLAVDLFGTLYIGAATALLLALLGILVASWLSARTRVINFALLRALGTEPTQLTGVLVWEQGIIYGLSILLGGAIGVMLSILVLPVLVITNGILSIGSSTDTNSIAVPPVRAIFPFPLIGLALGILVVICLLAIFLMTTITSRASISQALRLNED